jgi:hypothetical protein
MVLGFFLFFLHASFKFRTQIIAAIFKLSVRAIGITDALFASAAGSADTNFMIGELPAIVIAVALVVLELAFGNTSVDHEVTGHDDEEHEEKKDDAVHHVKFLGGDVRVGL